MSRQFAPPYEAPCDSVEHPQSDPSVQHVDVHEVDFESVEDIDVARFIQFDIKITSAMDNTNKLLARNVQSSMDTSSCCNTPFDAENVIPMDIYPEYNDRRNEELFKRKGNRSPLAPLSQGIDLSQLI
ncbi:hypothetical protein TSUD_284730 [Trifolium subterraneum]|uniref:Uncharacterized protein n=1 Tax=Trifolium subterraneum TaxID=3900 RepID=A0A2Z6PCE7_TRISU|nr:hypothetical protein TSUD_284730 [Trifolium subterraneum]